MGAASVMGSQQGAPQKHSLKVAKALGSEGVFVRAPLQDAMLWVRAVGIWPWLRYGVYCRSEQYLEFYCKSEQY